MSPLSLLGACATGALQSLLLVGTIAAIVSLAPRTDANSRHRVWFLTLLAAIALPFVDLFILVALPASSPATPQVALAGGPSALARIVVAPWIVALTLAIWALASTVYLLRVAWSFARLERLRRTTSPASHELQEQMLAWAARMGIERHVEVRTSAGLASPLAIGFTRPLIVLPDRLLATLDADDIEYICVHELAHLHRRDDLTNLFAKLARAIFIFNPAIFIAEWRMSLEREIACDDWVVATLGRARRYARCLAHVLLLSPPQAKAHGYLPFFRSARQSVQRIEMLLAPQSGRRRRRVFLASSGIAIAATLCLAGWAPQLVAFEIPLARLGASAHLDQLRQALFGSTPPLFAREGSSRVAFGTGNTIRPYRGPNEAPIILSAPVTIGGTARTGASSVILAAVVVPQHLNAAPGTDDTRSIDAESARSGAIAGDVVASADVPQTVSLQPVHFSATRFGIGEPIVPPRTPAVALSYNSYVLGPASIGGTSGAAAAAVAVSGTATGGGSGTGSLDGFSLPGGGIGAPGGSRTRGPLPGSRH